MKKSIAPLTILLVMVSVVVISEIRYAASIQPNGVRTLAQHIQRFGNPRFVYRVAHQDSACFELQGFPDGARPSFAFPSSAPAYNYDSKGELIDWCPNPGDIPKHREKWPRLSETPIDLQEFRKQFQL